MKSNELENDHERNMLPTFVEIFSMRYFNNAFFALKIIHILSILMLCAFRTY